MKKEKPIRIKYDKSQNGFKLLSKSGSLDTHYGRIFERKQCRTCEHLREITLIKEELFEENQDEIIEPLGICTLGIMWRVVVPRDSQDLVACSRLTMGIKDTCLKKWR